MLDPEMSSHTRQTLYARLGGYDEIARFVHELMPRLRQDPKLGIYWKGISLDSRRRSRSVSSVMTLSLADQQAAGPIEAWRVGRER